MAVLRWLGIVTACVCVSLAFAAWYTTPVRPWQHDVPASGDPNSYEPRQVLQNPVRPIIDPQILSANETDTAPNELVIGVEVDGHARAYPINQLTGPQREIINDVLGGTAIAATW